MTIYSYFYRSKIGRGGPPTRVLITIIKHPEIWPILGYFCLLWASPAEQCCTPVYLPIEDFQQKIPLFVWILWSQKRDGGARPTRDFSQTIKNPGTRPILECFCLLWGGAAQQCCTPVYLYSTV